MTLSPKQADDCLQSLEYAAPLKRNALPAHRVAIWTILGILVLALFTIGGGTIGFIVGLFFYSPNDLTGFSDFFRVRQGGTLRYPPGLIGSCIGAVVGIVVILFAARAARKGSQRLVD